MDLETAAFEKGANIAEKRLAQSAKQFEKLGERMGDLGQKLTIGLTAPLAVFAKKSVDGFVAQEKAMADVEAALASMGKSSGKTAKELLKTSDALELRSLYDGDVILKDVTANLLTFGNVAGREFDRAQQAALDMATRLGSAPKAAAISLGKALNDPIKGITALTRVGIQFTDAQKKQIEAMTKAGDVAGAQGIILSEVERQFKGAAAAAADATPWRQAQVSIGQAMDAIGAAILPVIVPAAEAVASLARDFATLSPPMQQAAVAAAAIAAAIGPLLFVFGPIVTAMAPFLAAIKTIAASQGIMVALKSGLIGLSTTLAPFAAAAVIAYLAWKDWDKIKPILVDLYDELQALGEGLGLVEGKAGATREELAKHDNARKLGKALADLNTELNKLAGYFTAAEKGANQFGVEVGNALSNGWRAFNDFTNQMNRWGANLAASLAATVKEFVNIGKNLIAGLARGITSSPGAVWNALKGVITSGITNAKALLGIKSPSRVFMEIGDFIGQGLAVGIEASTKRVSAAVKKMTDAARKTAEETRELFARLFPEIEAANRYKSDLKLIEGSGRSEDAQREARTRLSREFTGTTGPAPVSDAILNAAPIEGATIKVKNALDGLAGKAKVSTVRVADTFKDMADKTLASLQRMTDAIKGGGFLDILSAVIGFGLQLGSIGAFGKAIQTNINKIPGNANGTRNWGGGLSWVGERGPELVNLPRGSQVFTNRESMGMMGGKLQVEVIANNNGFGAIVRNHAGQVVAEAAPALIEGGGRAGAAKMTYQQRRRVA